MPEMMTAPEADALQRRLAALYREGYRDHVILGRIFRARRRVIEKRRIRRRLRDAGLTPCRPEDCR